MKKVIWNFLLVMSLWTTQTYAADLMDIYLQALENDPIFKAAYSNFLSKKEATPQAQSALLPQLRVRTQFTANQQNVTAGIFTIKEAYRSQQLQLTASQPLFNYQAWSQVQLARASVKAAHATFNDAAQDLIMRTASAYFNVLYAQDSLSFTEAKKRANKRQLDQAKQRFNVGLEPITSVYNAQSAYDQSTAEVIEASNNVVTQSERLRQITNHTYEKLAPLKDRNIPLLSPEPNQANDWISTSLRQNYKLMASKFELQSARENIKVQNSGHFPVFQLEGNSVDIRNINPGGFSNVPNTAISNNTGGNFFVPASQQVSFFGVTMNFPIFQGGLVESQTRQAQYGFQSSSEQMEQIYRSILVNTRIIFNSIMSGISKIKADRQTLMSQENTVQSTETQYLVGTRTMVDVVNAQQHLLEAQLQLAQDQYRYMNNILSLKYFAGTLNVADLEELNAWLATKQINQTYH